MSPINPPTTPPVIRPSEGLRLGSEFSEVGAEVGDAVSGDDSFLSPIAALNTSVAASWPHGSISLIGGPNHVGEYQFVLGNLALFRSELY